MACEALVISGPTGPTGASGGPGAAGPTGAQGPTGATPGGLVFQGGRVSVPSGGLTITFAAAFTSVVGCQVTVENDGNVAGWYDNLTNTSVHIDNNFGSAIECSWLAYGN